ncbi:hypothetical protein KIPB_014180, partial [Kipferlia bialata]|eukprot:g14180.t1
MSVFGSVVTFTYLSTSDIDITVNCRTSDVRRVSHLIHTQLSEASANSHAPFAIERVSLIRSEWPVIKCIVGGIGVDLSFNASTDRASYWLIHNLDTAISPPALFRSTLVLTKAWLSFDAHLLGGMTNMLSSSAVRCIACGTFLANPWLRHPLQTLLA